MLCRSGVVKDEDADGLCEVTGVFKRQLPAGRSVEATAKSSFLVVTLLTIALLPRGEETHRNDC